jgi:plastocyanin
VSCDPKAVPSKPRKAIARVLSTPIRGGVFALALAGVLALAGCGSSSSSSTKSTEAVAPAPAPATTTAQSTSTAAPSSSAPAQKLSLAADKEGQLKYDKSSLSAKAGKVEIAFTNASPLPHDVTVESSSGESVGATPQFQGGSKTLSVTLKAGTYKFFCSVPGHRQAGMEGTLTVN